MSESKYLARVQPIELRGLADAERFAHHAAEARFFGWDSQEKALMVLARGMELGLPPAAALCSMHVIGGKPTLSAAAKVAIVKSRRDVCEFFREVESTDEHATFETKRVGDPPVRETWTLEDAKRAELLGNKMWAKYPRNMLRARASAALADKVYQDLFMGLLSTEEARDIEEQEQRAAYPETREERPADPPAIRANVTIATPPAAPTQAPAADPIADLVAKFERAATKAEVQSLCSEATKLKLAEGSPDRAKLLQAYNAAVARITGPKDDGPKGGAPQPSAEAPADAASEPAQAEAPADIAAALAQLAEFVARPDAWAAHLSAEPNAIAVARAYLKREDAFARFNVDSDRWNATAAELRRRGINDPEGFAQKQHEILHPESVAA